jgi:hypothetical protein
MERMPCLGNDEEYDFYQTYTSLRPSLPAAIVPSHSTKEGRVASTTHA